MSDRLPEVKFISFHVGVKKKKRKKRERIERNTSVTGKGT